MKLLVLGGTGFLGYHMVAQAAMAGHEITTFNRDGVSDFADVEAIQGDRHGGLSALGGRRWDAVIDTFSDATTVAATARLLAPNVAAYGFVSGMSVYHPNGPDVVDEQAPVRRDEPGLADDPLQQRSLDKLACEQAGQETFNGRVLIIRPGNMVGPRDPTDRFTCWPLRFQRALADGEEVLAPGTPDRAVQFSDARDIAAWLVTCLDPDGHQPEPGVYNTVGPARQNALGEVLSACRAAAAVASGRSDDTAGAHPVWAGMDFLAVSLANVDQENRPLWFPEPQIPFAWADSGKARDAGLIFRSAADTARDTLAWRAKQHTPLAAGLAPDVERDLIATWVNQAEF